jgi:hypothetical protein
VNASAIVGATFAFTIGIAHSFLGERYILIRLFQRSDLPRLFGSDDFTRRTLRVAWHLTTLAWWGFAAILLVLADAPPLRGVSNAIAVTFGATALATLIGSRGRHLAWPVFATIAIAAWAAGRG